MAVLSMSKQEFSRLEVLLRVQSGRLRVSDACVLIGLQRRQVFRLLRGLKQDGATSLGFQAPRQTQQSSAAGRSLRPSGMSRGTPKLISPIAPTPAASHKCSSRRWFRPTGWTSRNRPP